MIRLFKRGSAVLPVFTLMILSFFISGAESKGKEPIAVPYDYVSISPSLDLDKKMLVSEIEGYLVKTGKFRVVPRQDIPLIVNEIAMSGGNTSNSFASNLFLTCSIAKDGGQISLVIKILRIIPGKHSEIWKTGPYFTAVYDKNSYRTSISEMLLNSIKVLFEDKKDSFEYAIKLFSKGDLTRSAQIIQFVGTDFLPKEVNTCQKHELAAAVKVLDPEEAYRKAWAAYEKGDLKTAAEYFLSCREILKIKDFNELLQLKGNGKTLKNPVFQRKWIITDLDMVFQPIRPGKIIFQWNDGEKTVHSEISQNSHFWISEKEITVRQYQIFLESVRSVESIDSYVDFEKSECPFKKDLTLKKNIPADSPMVGVSWPGAVAFTEWLTRQERKRGCLPAGYSYRLPWEKEWDYAARTGTGNPVFHTREYAVSSSGLDQPLELYKKTGSVKSDKNGVYDMYGNVWEWCLDWYNDQYPTDRKSNRESADDCKVVRGGCYYSTDTDFSDLRSSKNFRFTFQSVGFRIILAPVIDEGD